MFDFSFINIWADVMTHIQDVSAERQKKASFNNASYQGNNTVELTFAVSGAKANGSVEPSTSSRVQPRQRSPKHSTKCKSKRGAKREPKHRAKCKTECNAKCEPKHSTKCKTKYKTKREPKHSTKFETEYNAKRESKHSAESETEYNAKREPKYKSKCESGHRPKREPKCKSECDAIASQLGQPSVTAKGFVVYAKVKGAGKSTVGSRYIACC